jgi:hypothetical protein
LVVDEVQTLGSRLDRMERRCGLGWAGRGQARFGFVSVFVCVIIGSESGWIAFVFALLLLLAASVVG